MNTARKLAFWLLLASAPLALSAQVGGGGEDAAAYARAVGEHFRVPPEEVAVLSEWGLAIEEIPVVLFLARRGGMSADALATLKRGGQSWFQLAQRSGLDAGSFLVPLPESAGGGPLASA